MKQSKIVLILIIILSVTLISGCVGQSGTEEQENAHSFDTIGDAYESGFQLKCEKVSEDYRSTYYIADKNLRLEISVSAGTTYKIITYDNQTYNWTEVNEGVPDPNDELDEAEFLLKFTRRIFLLMGSLEDRTCIEQSIPQSMFEPPRQ